MKYVIWILFIAAVASIVCGFLLDTDWSQKLLGFGVLGLFFQVIPLFTYYRWKDRSVSDYYLTNENLKKMRDFDKRKKS